MRLTTLINILVTHQVDITALTKYYPSHGEIVSARMFKTAKLLLLLLSRLTIYQIKKEDLILIRYSKIIQKRCEYVRKTVVRNSLDLLHICNNPYLGHNSSNNYKYIFGAKPQYGFATDDRRSCPANNPLFSHAATIYFNLLVD